MQQMIFITDLIACSTCFGYDYAHRQELGSIIWVVAACGTWCFGLQVVGLVWSCRLCVRFGFAQHVSGTIMSIIRSSRVLYRWLLPVLFGALVFKLLVWCGAEGCVPDLRAAVAARKPDT